MNAAPASSVRRATLVAAATASGLGGWLAWQSLGPDREIALPIGSNPVEAALAEFWQTAFTGIDDQPLPARRFQGKPLVVNFWGTWCPPCVEELPLIEAFYQAHRSRGWQVLALAADSGDKVRKFLQKHPLSFTIAADGAAVIAWSRRLGNLSGGLPFTLVLDSSGRVAQTKLGQLKPADINAWAQIT